MNEHARIAAAKAAFAVIAGRQAIEEFWCAGIEVGITQAEFETAEVHRQNGLAYEIGHYALRLEADGGDVVDRGKYVLVHERQEDGSWLGAVEMFNPDDAPGPARGGTR
jgi:ketosteroid isomerase-like protein